MKFKYVEIKDKNNLIHKLYTVSLSKKDVPFQSIIIPNGYPTLTYISNGSEVSLYNSKKKIQNRLIISGQHYQAYDFKIKSKGVIYCIEFNPTAFYKIFKTDLSTISNKHIHLSLIDQKKSKEFMNIFLNVSDKEATFEKEMLSYLENLDVYENDDITQIEKAINLIFEKEGMLQISDLLDLVPFSQKTLESKFKKIIGLTPGKYIRLIRFTSLIRQYNSHKTDLKTLMYNYNYYDKSHLKKDFLRFLNKTPKSYFKEDYPLLKKYLK